MTPTIAEQLARWSSALTFDDLPPEVVDHAREALRDVVANAALGVGQHHLDPYRRLSAPVAAGTGATVVGARRQWTLRDAVFLNAILAHSSELDDVIRGAGGHPGVSVVPAVLGLGEELGSTGRDVIVALVVGYEVMHRVTAPIHPQHLERGFQGTGLGGPFAAAAAAAKLQDLDLSTTSAALAIAGSFATGICEYDQSGGEVKRIYAGLAARSGLEATFLAREGLTGPPSILEGPHGVFQAFAASCDPEEATRDLGSEFRITRRRMKCYPTVAGLHSSIDAVAAVISAHDIAPSRVRRVTLHVAPATLAHGGAVTVPTDLVTAQFSLAFSVALRMVVGSNELADYQDPARWSDPAITELASRVRAVADPLAAGPSRNRARVVIELDDGTVLEHVQHAPVGSPENPLGREDLDERFDRMMGRAFSPGRTAEVAHAIAGLEDARSVSPLVALLAHDPQAGGPSSS